MPPLACEPIIYLYPERETEVHVSIGRGVKVTDSHPYYDGRWNLVVSPSGRIKDKKSGRVYPYLFWEGWSFMFPQKNEGFVVEREDVEDFLSSTLVKLGLNEKEKDDFLLAWLPKFQDAPYYFITFLEKDDVDRFFPINVYPKPDTFIRVFMDFRPLSVPVAVKEPLLKDPPKRKGFTVVEWGGARR